MAHGVSFCSMQQSVVERKSSCMAIQPVRILKIPLSGLTFAPLFGKYLAHMYQKADYVITPSEYSKHLIQSYGVTTPIIAVSNGIDLEKYKKDPKKKKSFASILISKKAKGCHLCRLYFKRKGIEDFVEVARRMPDVRFILARFYQQNGSFRVRFVVSWKRIIQVMWNSLATSRERSSKGL